MVHTLDRSDGRLKPVQVGGRVWHRRGTGPGPFSAPNRAQTRLSTPQTQGRGAWDSLGNTVGDLFNVRCDGSIAAYWTLVASVKPLGGVRCPRDASCARTRPRGEHVQAQKGLSQTKPLPGTVVDACIEHANECDEQSAASVDERMPQQRLHRAHGLGRYHREGAGTSTPWIGPSSVALHR